MSSIIVQMMTVGSLKVREERRQKLKTHKYNIHTHTHTTSPSILYFTEEAAEEKEYQ